MFRVQLRSQWLKPLIEKGVLNWCDGNGVEFKMLLNLKQRNGPVGRISVVSDRCCLPTVFELTGDFRWDKEGELYSRYDLHLDNDADDRELYPDEKTVIAEDDIFDDEHAPEKGKAAVKVLSEKSYSEVLKMVDDLRKSEQERGSNDAASINLGKEFSEILSPGGYGMVN